MLVMNSTRYRVTIVPFYDRSDLIEQAVDPLRYALVEEIILVTLALMHLRSILIVTISLPVAVLSACTTRVSRPTSYRPAGERPDPNGEAARGRCRIRGTNFGSGCNARNNSKQMFGNLGRESLGAAQVCEEVGTSTSALARRLKVSSARPQRLSAAALRSFPIVSPSFRLDRSDSS